MSTRYSGWGVAGEQPKPAVKMEGWAAKNNGWGPPKEQPISTVKNNTGWRDSDGWANNGGWENSVWGGGKGALEEKPEFNIDNSGWGSPREQPAFKFDSSGRGVNLAPNTNDTGKKEVACTRCKNSFPSNNKLHQHIREGDCRSVQPKGGSDAEDFRQRPNSTWIGNGRGASKTVKEKAANEGAAENTSSNAKEERCGDSNSKCSDFTSPFGYIPPQLNFRNKTRDVSSKFDQLVQDGALNSKEIQLLEKSRGLEFLVHLTHLESMASTKTWKTMANHVDGIPKTEIDQDYLYCTVHALLIRWEDGDLDFDWAINGLREVFKDQFGFHSVSSFKIPSNRPYEALESKLQYFKKAHSSKSRLLIVYYVGYGYLDLQNRMHWCATRWVQRLWCDIKTKTFR
jgi:hypothetical protein